MRLCCFRAAFNCFKQTAESRTAVTDITVNQKESAILRDLHCDAGTGGGGLSGSFIKCVVGHVPVVHMFIYRNIQERMIKSIKLNSFMFYWLLPAE